MPRVPRSAPRSSARRDRPRRARLRRGNRAAARGGVVGHEDRPPRRPRRVPGRRGVGVVADRRPRPRARRAVRGLPVPDGPVLRARRPGRAGALAHASAVARRGADGRRRRGRAARRRARPAGREPGAAHRRRDLPAQPVRRRLPQPHLDHAAGVRAAAVAAARRPPRAAAPAQLVVAGGRGAARGGVRRRGECRGAGVAAARPARAADLRAGDRRGALERRPRVRAAHRGVPRGRVAVVGGAGGRPRALRARLPAVHRAAGRDLEHDQRLRGPAPDGLLDLVRGRRLRRRPAAVHVRRRGDALPPRRARGLAAGPGARRTRARDRPAVGVRAVLPAATARRRGDRRRRLPGRHAAAAGGARRLLPGRRRPVPAHDLQGRAADRGRVRAARCRRRTRRLDARALGGAAARRRAPAVGVAAGPGRGGRLAAGVGGDPARVDRGGARPRRRPADQHARGRASGPAVRDLRLGVDRRPDPARPQRPPGGGADRARVRRPPVRRPAVDRRQPDSAGARGRRPAAAAAAAARRRGGDRRCRRRPRAQRRDRPFGRGPRALTWRARRARSPLRPAAAGGRRGRDACAAGARTAGRSVRHAGARGDRARRTGRPADAGRRVRQTRSPASPPSTRSTPRGRSPTPRTGPRRSCGPQPARAPTS